MRWSHVKAEKFPAGLKSAWIGLAILSGCGEANPSQKADVFGNPAEEEATSMGLPVQSGLAPELDNVRVDVYDGGGNLLCCLTIGEVHRAFAERNVVQTRQDGPRILIAVVPRTGSGNWDRMELIFATMDTGGYGLIDISQDGIHTYTMGGSVRGNLGNTNHFLISAFPGLRWDEAYSKEQTEMADEQRRVLSERSGRESAELVRRNREIVMTCRDEAYAQFSDRTEAFAHQEECIREKKGL